MKRLAFLALFSVVAMACGDDGDSGGTPDADNGDPGNPGFVTPTETTKAWDSQGGQWVEVGDANWDCVGTPSDDTATTVAVTLSGRVNDFQTGDPVGNANITIFHDVDFSDVITTTTADAGGEYTATIPAGVTRFGFLTATDGTLDTYLLNQKLAPATAEQSINVNSVSELTANALPAFIGVTRTPGTGVLAGAIRDCDNNEVSNAIATVSSTSGSATHLQGAATYYFSAGSTELPVRHNQQRVTNSNGLFVVVELPPASEAYLQIWGFTAAQDPATDDLTLLAEIPAPVLAESVITLSVEPLRSE